SSASLLRGPPPAGWAFPTLLPAPQGAASVKRAAALLALAGLSLAAGLAAADAGAGAYPGPGAGGDASAGRDPGAPSGAGSPLRRFALILGANDGGRERTRLRYAVADARAFAQVLQNL